MSAPDKATLWNQLKEAGWTPPPSKPYVQWKVDELELEYNTLLAQQLIDDTMNEPDSTKETSPISGRSIEELLAAGPGGTPESPASGPEAATPAPQVTAPAPGAETSTSPAPGDDLETLAPSNEAVAYWRERFPHLPITDEGDKIAGLRINTHGPDDPIRIDTRGRLWFQDEVRKSSVAKPRARRKLRYKDTGVKTVVQRNQLGLVEESFEVAGDQSVDMEVKVTLPSWQVGIYVHPNMKDFRIHTYGDQRGLDRLDVLRYFGGKDLVPSTCKEIYVGSDSCYDIISVRDTIERLYRENVLRIGTLS